MYWLGVIERVTLAGMQEEFLARTVEQSADAVVITDAREGDHPLVYVNPAFETLTGYSRDELLGRNCRFLQGEHREQPYRHVMRASLNRGEPAMGIIENLRKDGTRFWNLIGLSPIKDKDGELSHYLGIMRDISQFLAPTDGEAESPALSLFGEQLARLIVTDSLTGVANRRHFDEVVEREWSIAQRHGDFLTLGMIDIDYFKPYNDDYGHLEGDACLRRVAEVLNRHFQRAGDLLARYGGDEFVVLCPRQTAAILGARLELVREEIEALAIPGGADAILPVVTISAGVAELRPWADSTPDALIEAADRALYRAKKEGRNRVLQSTEVETL